MTLKFLTDENVSASLVKTLRNKNYTTKDIKEERLFSISDNEVLRLAIKENRVIITHDKDFANLVSYSTINIKVLFC